MANTGIVVSAGPSHDPPCVIEVGLPVAAYPNGESFITKQCHPTPTHPSGVRHSERGGRYARMVLQDWGAS